MLKLSSHSSICWIHKWSQGQGKLVMHQFQASAHQSEVSVLNSSGDHFQSQFLISLFFCLTYSIHTFKNKEPSGSFQLIGHHLYLFHFAWGGVGVNSDDVIEHILLWQYMTPFFPSQAHTSSSSTILNVTWFSPIPGITVPFISSLK